MISIKKNFFIVLIWFIMSIIIATLSTVLALMKVIDINNPNKSIFVFVCAIISFLILGFLSGNIKQKKGMLNGIILSLFILIIFFLINFLGFNEPLSFKIIPKYVALILSSGLGGIFGVNFKPIVK